MAAKKSPTTADDGGDTPSFEVALARLETIVEELEGGSLTLEESIARYEEGVKLSRRLSQTLDEAEKRIERLVAVGDGTASTEPMELREEDAAPAPPAAPSRPAPQSAPRAPARPRDPGSSDDPGELPF